MEEIENCIHTVSQGVPYFSPKIKELLGSNSLEDGSLNVLTPSEKKILKLIAKDKTCLLYTSDAADDMQCVDLGGRRIIKK